MTLNDSVKTHVTKRNIRAHVNQSSSPASSGDELTNNEDTLKGKIFPGANNPDSTVVDN